MNQMFNFGPLAFFNVQQLANMQSAFADPSMHMYKLGVGMD